MRMYLRLISFWMPCLAIFVWLAGVRLLAKAELETEIPI